MSEIKKNLHQKISAVMQDVQYLTKDDHIKFNKTNYRAISEEKVTSTVRESLIKNGLVILPVVQDHSREGTLSTVDTTYKIVDVDTGDHELIVSSGTGVDTQDKGVGKAMTYSYKYLLLRTFAIPTGEDPDKVSSAELDVQQKKRNNNQASAITQEQVGTLKMKALEFAKVRNRTEQEVYQVLKISDVTKLTQQQAQNHIKQLETWIKGANK